MNTEFNLIFNIQAQVARAVNITMAGGEEEFSERVFRWMKLPGSGLGIIIDPDYIKTHKPVG